MMAISNHNGPNLNCGHYYNYARHADNWNRISDTVSRIAKKSDLESSDSYLLLYERVDTHNLTEMDPLLSSSEGEISCPEPAQEIFRKNGSEYCGKKRTSLASSITRF